MEIIYIMWIIIILILLFLIIMKYYKKYLTKKKILKIFRNIGDQVSFRTYNDYGKQIYKQGIVNSSTDHNLVIIIQKHEKEIIKSYCIILDDIYPKTWFDKIID